MIITMGLCVPQIDCKQKGASTGRIYEYYYGKCGRQVLKMLDRVGYCPIRDSIHYGTKT